MAWKCKTQWLLAATLLVGCLAPVQAWNSTGHMTVADIAYDNLNAKTKASVDALLTHQRDYSLWMSELPAGYTDRARFAFMKAATWPDDIRKTPDDRPIWHYVDVPVIAPGYTPDPIALLPVKPNAETQIAAETSLLATASAADADRAVALCWVEHLVGDVHQPLHDASLYSPLFPKGDKGGNDESLTEGAVTSDRLETQAHPHKLHALWDDALGNTQAPQEIEKFAALLETPAYGRAAFPQLTAHPAVHDWVLEGNALAQKDAYWNFALPMTAAADGKEDVTLPSGYLDTLHTVSDRQIALAGLRLADLLNAQTWLPVTPLGALASATPPAPMAATQNAAPASAPASGMIIGNLRTHIYHLPGDTRHLPSERNRIYFKTEADAQAAGYHKSGS